MRKLLLTAMVGIIPLISYSQDITPQINSIKNVKSPAAISWRYDSTIGLSHYQGSVLEKETEEQVSTNSVSSYLVSFQASIFSFEFSEIEEDYESHIDKRNNYLMALRFDDSISIGIGHSTYNWKELELEDVNRHSNSIGLSLRMAKILYFGISGEEVFENENNGKVGNKWINISYGGGILYGKPRGFHIRLEQSIRISGEKIENGTLELSENKHFGWKEVIISSELGLWNFIFSQSLKKRVEEERVMIRQIQGVNLFLDNGIIIGVHKVKEEVEYLGIETVMNAYKIMVGYNFL